jgi:DNA polymerase-3 subunit gamma/tau
METVGQAVVDMREALDPRVTLEVAVVRLARPDADVSPGALLERIERLERGLSGHVTAPARAEARAVADEAMAAPPTVASEGPPAPTPAVPPPPRPTDGARAALGALRQKPAATPERPPNPATAPPTTAPATTPTRPATGGPLPSRDAITKAWGDTVLGALPPRARSRLAGGRFLAVDDGAAVYALPNQIHAQRCEEVRPEAEAALAAHFGSPVPLRLVVDTAPSPAAQVPSPPPEEDVELDDLRDAAPAVTSPEERVKQAFPGAEEVGQG